MFYIARYTVSISIRIISVQRHNTLKESTTLSFVTFYITFHAIYYRFTIYCCGNQRVLNFGASILSLHPLHTHTQCVFKFMFEIY
jgi:hypothetical protein